MQIFKNKNSVLDEHLTFIFGIKNETPHFSELYTPIYLHGITSWNKIIFLFLNVRNIYIYIYKWQCYEPKYYIYPMKFITRCGMNTSKRGYKSDVVCSALNISFPLCTSTCICKFVFQEFVILCLCSGVNLESLELAVILCSVYIIVSCHNLILVLITVIIILIDREMIRSRLQRWIDCTHSS